MLEREKERERKKHSPNLGSLKPILTVMLQELSPLCRGNYMKLPLSL